MITIQVSKTAPVAKDESKNCTPLFATVTEAINAIDSLAVSSEEPILIEIYPGTYYEKITLQRDNVTLVGMGDSPEAVVLTYDDYAFKSWDASTKYGTFRSYTFFLDANNVTLKNLTISNTSGDENQVGQAISLYAEGDHIQVDSCRLLGRQDTLFTGPLPEKEIQPGGFIGPKQFAPRVNGRQYYRNTYICGNVDFIFGSATAYFENCEIESLSHAPSKEIQGYVTAPSTKEGQAYGYVFLNCTFSSKECPNNTVYLGRPWREYAKSVFINCTLGSHIHPALFHDWNKPFAREASFFAISGLTDKNGNPYPIEEGFYHILEQNELRFYDCSNLSK